MANKDYRLKPALGTVKQGFSLEDENGNVVYSAKMKKFKFFGASPFEFINHLTNKTEEHILSKVVTQTESGIIGMFSVKSSFKYDGEKIWDYLHNKGIRIDTKPSANKIGATYEVSFEGKPIATVATSSQKGKSLITTDLFYDVTCDEKDIELVFLVALSIARTEQLFYD